MNVLGKYVWQVAFTLLCLLSIQQVRAADIFNGQSVYESRCSMCHGERGKGEMPGTPDLSKQQGMQKSDRNLLKRLSSGKGSCPPFGGIIRDQNLKDVISYLRTMRR